MFRYAALLRRVDTDIAVATTQRLRSKLLGLGGGWRSILAVGPLEIFATHNEAGHRALAGRSGALLGSAYHRQRTHEFPRADPPLRDDALTIESLLDAGPSRLITDLWGDYVALRAAPDAAWVLRSPTGALPCLQVRCDDITVLCSNISDLIALKTGRLRGRMDYLLRHLRWEFGALEAPLEEVVELIGGECVEFALGASHSGERRRPLWTPRPFIERRTHIDVAEVKQALRATLVCCTHSLTLDRRAILHRLSGGLDSSIVAACLSHTYPAERVNYYTYFDPSGRGDERAWARLTASHLRRTHIERAFDPMCLPLPRIAELAPTPRPTSLLPYLQRAPLERALCAEFDADVVFSGEGGDSALCRDALDCAAMDFVRDRGMALALTSLCATIGRHTHSSVWQVFLDAWRGAHRREASIVSPEWIASLTRLVDPDLAPSSQTASLHPWFAEERSASLARRLGVLTQGLDFYDPSTPVDAFAPAHAVPLTAQPVVELCLQIPSYVHLLDGRDRGLARAAFADDLPPQILMRRWKHRAPGFLEAVLHHHRDFVRAFLLEGVLVRLHMLSRSAIERALSDAPSSHQVSPVELVNHLNTEAWARHWFT